MIRKTDTTIMAAPTIEQMTMAAISPPLNEDEESFSSFVVVWAIVDEAGVTEPLLLVVTVASETNEPLLVVTVVSETNVTVVLGRPVVTFSGVAVDANVLLLFGTVVHDVLFSVVVLSVGIVVHIVWFSVGTCVLGATVFDTVLPVGISELGTTVDVWVL